MGDLTNLPNFEPAPAVYTHTDMNQVFGELAVKPLAVTTAKLADKAVTTQKLQLGAVSSDRLANGAVAASKLADGAVTNPKVADGAVATVKLQDGAVTAAKLADQAVNAVKLGDGSVNSAKLQDGAVTQAKLADGAVTAAKIANGQVTQAKLAGDVQLGVADGSVTTAKLANGAVTAAKLEGNKEALRNNLGLGKGDYVTHGGYTSEALGTNGADITLIRNSSGVNEKRFWITFHGGTLYLRQMNDSGTIKNDSIVIEPTGRVVFGGDVQIASGKSLQLGQGLGPPVSMTVWGNEGPATMQSPGSLTIKAANGQDYKVPCWPA